MSKKRRLIPFSFTPTSWAMKGKTRTIAELEYYYEGQELERKLVAVDHEEGSKEFYLKHLELDRKHDKIDSYNYEQKKLGLECKDIDSLEYKLAKLDIDHNYDKLTEYEHNTFKAHLTNKPESIELKEELLKLDLKFGNLTEHQYNKDIATLKEEPWVAVKESGFEPRNGSSGFFFDLDYNEYFVRLLANEGYRGITDEQVVEQWFRHLCKSTIEESGVVEVDISNILPHPLTRKTTGENGTAEYS